MSVLFIAFALFNKIEQGLKTEQVYAPVRADRREGLSKKGTA
jgi:hypothetical protein